MNDTQDDLPEINPKKISFLYGIFVKLFPDFFVFDTYRDTEFARIDKGDNYAQSLDYQDKAISKYCKVIPNISRISGFAFLSHAKRDSISLPYAGKRKAIIHYHKKNKNIPNEDFDLIEKIDYEFHLDDKYRIKFSGQILERKLGNLEESEELDIEKYIYEKIKVPISNDSNDIILITGDIGCGKSTLLTNVLYHVINDQFNAMNERPKSYRRVEYVLIDFENIPTPDSDDIEIFVSKIINTHILNTIKKQLNIKASDIESAMKKTSHASIILAFDNLDSLYTEFCKKLFIDNDEADNEVEIKKYYPFLYELIYQFTVGKHSHLGIRCVFAARNETAELLKNGLCIDDGDRSPFDMISSHIQLQSTTGEYIRGVIRKRIDLARDNIMNPEEKILIKLNSDELLKVEKEFFELNLLSIQGLRHTMSVCKELSWALSNKNTFKRFFVNTEATRIFHYLGGKTHYSQIHEGVTNIFLVNNRYRRENNQFKTCGTPLFNEDDLQDHLHTYWLKYFVLQYIYKTNVDKASVLKFFSNNGKRGYPVHLLKLVIYSLSEIKHGRLIRPDTSFGNGSSIISSGIKCTKRAKYLIENELFWSFSYLSLVVEDEWIEYPVFIKDKFSYPKGFDFLYYSDDEMYLIKYAEYLYTKAEQVLVFLDLLDISLEFEKKKYPEIFEYLSKREVNPPNLKSIRKNVIKTIHELKKILDIEKQKKVISGIKKGNNFFYRIRLKNQLRKLFKKAYYTGFVGNIKLAVCKK